MKRIRAAPGKFVTISDELAEKAARMFATGQLTCDQVRELVAAEPRLSSGAMWRVRPACWATTINNALVWPRLSDFNQLADGHPKPAVGQQKPNGSVARAR